MTSAPKVFLTISITAFALSFTAVGSEFGWGILKPLSAVTFILFFITNWLAREVALYDEEQRRNPERRQEPRDSSKAATSLEPAPAK